MKLCVMLIFKIEPDVEGDSGGHELFILCRLIFLSYISA